MRDVWCWGCEVCGVRGVWCGLRGVWCGLRGVWCEGCVV